MSKVSSDSKVKHIHKRTFCQRYFFFMKNIDLEKKNCFERKYLNNPYQIDKINKGKVIQTIACVFRAIECMVCRCESAEVGLKFRVKMAASVASSKFAHFSIITQYLRKPTA